MTTPSRLCHFSIPADDPEQAAEFYVNVFGWKVQYLEEPAEYWFLAAGESDGPEPVIGGITRRSNPSQNHLLTYFNVQTIEEALKKVERNGGKVLQARHEIPGYGAMAICADPEGNVFAFWEQTAS